MRVEQLVLLLVAGKAVGTVYLRVGLTAALKVVVKVAGSVDHWEVYLVDSTVVYLADCLDAMKVVQKADLSAAGSVAH